MRFGYDGDGRRLWKREYLPRPLGVVVRLTLYAGYGFEEGYVEEVVPHEAGAGEPPSDVCGKVEGVTDLGFTGQRQEIGFGLYDYNARYFSPALGRFISPDSIVPNFANPQSLNRYSYVYGNPLKFTDPSGHCGTAAVGGGTGSFATPLNTFCEGFGGGGGAVTRGVPSGGSMNQALADMVAIFFATLGLRSVPDVNVDFNRPDSDDPRQMVIVELGSGDFANLIQIAQDYPNERVIGIENNPFMKIMAARPGSQVNLNYLAATAAGAEVLFEDFGQGLPYGIQADEIISIAPDPNSVPSVVRATVDIKSGGRIYIATGIGETTGPDLERTLQIAHGVTISRYDGRTRYPSSYFGTDIYSANIIDFIVP